MSNLSVQERDGVLVVDSRLVADRLEIAHKNLLSTVDKYKERIEPAFGKIAFETRKSGRGKPERFAWLTEDQATFLMTLSRNTDEVVQCKLELVEAFSKAKQVIKEVIPAQSQEIERLKLELELARAQDSAARSQERLIQTTQAIATLHGTGMVALILGKPEAVVEPPPTVIEKTILVNQSGRPVKTYQGLG